MRNRISSGKLLILSNFASDAEILGLRPCISPFSSSSSSSQKWSYADNLQIKEMQLFHQSQHQIFTKHNNIA